MELTKRAADGKVSAVPETRIKIDNYRKVTILFTQSMVIPDNAFETWQKMIKAESRNLALGRSRLPVRATIAPN